MHVLVRLCEQETIAAILHCNIVYMLFAFQSLASLMVSGIDRVPSAQPK